jgi:hypothetical protein
MTFVNFLIGLPAMLLCLIVQTAVAFWCVRYYVRLSPQVGSGQGFLAGIRPLIVATLALLVGNLVQIMLWGALFLWLGEFEQAYDAIYHSAVNFSSLGYGDIVMSRERRLLGPLEAVNGVLMLGMSAATLMAIVQHMIGRGGCGTGLARVRAARAWLLGVLTWFPSPPGAQGIVEAQK